MAARSKARKSAPRTRRARAAAPARAAAAKSKKKGRRVPAPTRRRAPAGPRTRPAGRGTEPAKRGTGVGIPGEPDREVRPQDLGSRPKSEDVARWEGEGGAPASGTRTKPAGASPGDPGSLPAQEAAPKAWPFGMDEAVRIAKPGHRPRGGDAVDRALERPQGLPTTPRPEERRLPKDDLRERSMDENRRQHLQRPFRAGERRSRRPDAQSGRSPPAR